MRQLEDLAVLCQDADSMDADDGDTDLSALCASGCFGEMNDCRAELEMSGMDGSDLTAIQMMSTMCDPGNADCIAGMDTVAARVDQACADQPCWGDGETCIPTSCSHECAVVLTPFMKQCGSVLGALIDGTGDPVAAAQFHAERSLCKAATTGH